MTALSTELWQPTPSSTIDHIQRLRVRLNEESIIDFIAGLSPWIAPLPSAVFVQQAANRHLHSGETLSWGRVLLWVATTKYQAALIGAY